MAGMNCQKNPERATSVGAERISGLMQEPEDDETSQGSSPDIEIERTLEATLVQGADETERDKIRDDIIEELGINAIKAEVVTTQPSPNRKRVVITLVVLLAVTATLLIVLLLNRNSSDNDGDIDIQTGKIGIESMILRNLDELISAVDKYLNQTDEERTSNDMNINPIAELGPISTWDVSRVDSMKDVFNTERNPLLLDMQIDLSNWDVSNCTSLRDSFKGITYYNKDGEGWGLEHWNTSNVEEMQGVFSGSDLLDFNLSGWDTGKVTSMTWMFFGANSFQGVGMENWDVSNVEKTDYMLRESGISDVNLSMWNTSKLLSAKWMFTKALDFQGVGLDSWVMDKVTDISNMFSETKFDVNVSKWNLSQVANMKGTFFRTRTFKGIGLENWKVSSVTEMDSVFEGAENMDADLSSWDTSEVTTMHEMFWLAKSFTGRGLEHWNVSKVTSMFNMFHDAYLFNANLSRWDISKVTDMTSAFEDARSFTGVGVEHWNTSEVTTMRNMFAGATIFDNNLSLWDTSKVRDMGWLFESAQAFSGAGVDVWNVSGVTDMRSMMARAFSFDSNLASWNSSQGANMDAMFYEAVSFRGEGLEEWDWSRMNESKLVGALCRTGIDDTTGMSAWNVNASVLLNCTEPAPRPEPY